LFLFFVDIRFALSIILYWKFKGDILCLKALIYRWSGLYILNYIQMKIINKEIFFIFLFTIDIRFALSILLNWNFRWNIICLKALIYRFAAYLSFNKIIINAHLIIYKENILCFFIYDWYSLRSINSSPLIYPLFSFIDIPLKRHIFFIYNLQ